MAGLQAPIVSDRSRSSFLEPDSANKHASSIRSLSPNPSIRSSRSRITLVEYDSDLAANIKVTDDAISGAKEFTWLDHLLAVFCIPRKEKDRSAQIPREKQEPERRVGPPNSPWVLPVYVLSPHRDASRHLIPKEAKCTIDTGNLQGNIVSKAFVIDILGYSESSFHELTTEEEYGGTGVTGHKLIPESAIYLTWYHNNSTRVFRDMRFLISEHPMYDLIIGARSIHEHNILDVPNLMAGSGGGAIEFNLGTKTSPQFENLLGEMNRARQKESAAKIKALAAETKLKKLAPADPKVTAAEKYAAGLAANLHNLNEIYCKAMADYEIEGIRLQEEQSKIEATSEREEFEKKHKGKGYVLPLPPGGKDKELKKRE